MMDDIKYKSRNRAVTLVEVILALALGALILASLTQVFKTGLQSWKEDNERGELIQHARVAMGRIVDDLRYAQKLDQLPTPGPPWNLEFTTVNLLSGSGEIEYKIVNSELSRIEEGTSSTIAGSFLEGIYVTRLDSAPLKVIVVEVDGEEEERLVELVGDDNPSVAIAVRVALELQDADGNTFTLSSMAKLRNKQ